MKKVILLLTACLAAAAASGMGSLVTSFQLPEMWIAEGIGCLGSGRVIYEGLDDIYHLSSINGSVITSFPEPIENCGACDAGTIGGIGGRSYLFYAGGNTFQNIYRFGALSGSIYGSFASPGIGLISGVAFRKYNESNYLILTQGLIYPWFLYRVDALSGDVYASYPLDFQAFDIAHDGARYCYWVADRNAHLIRRINYQGRRIDSFDCCRYPMGVGYDPINKYVYVSCCTADYVYVYETAEEDGGITALTPSSLGKVKAVFR